MKFPIDLSQYKPLQLDPKNETLSEEKKQQLKKNIQVARDSIIFFTAYAGAKGQGGHTGGPYDIVPEVLIVDGFMKGPANIYPAYFDEAGHRVAIQYLMAVLNNELPEERLLHYREYSKKNPLPGHPELGLTDGIKFSSGRLGHMWSFANGVAKANPDATVFLFGSDGSQQEGNDAEAARFCVANNLNVKVVIDDNNVTIAGHPSEYMKGYNVKKTLEGHRLETNEGDGENLDELYSRIRNVILENGPRALINKRKMAIDVPEIEGEPEGHDVIKAEPAIKYLEKRGHAEAVDLLKNAEKIASDYEYKGSSKEKKKNRDEFGKIIVDILKNLSDKERKNNYVIDCDLEGSTGLHHIYKAFPELYVHGGVMERNNYGVAAGFGFDENKQGIFATFSAFSEMVNSEITMARLNEANVLAHFSHAGIDYISDNTCHFGMNIFFTDNGLTEEKQTKLYFPADTNQLKKILEKVFHDKGLRFVFSTRSGLPLILKEDGEHFFDEKYAFEPGKDDVIRNGKDGYIVSYGALLYRSLDAVERLKKEGIDVGLVNKNTLNLVDMEMMKKLSQSKFVLVAEDQNQKTGLGIRFGTYLLKHGFTGKYDYMGTTVQGYGGQDEQIIHQGLDSEHIQKKVKELSK